MIQRVAVLGFTCIVQKVSETRMLAVWLKKIKNNL